MPDPESSPDPARRSDPGPSFGLPSAQDDAVRALLASARHTGTAPPDVVARLESTLASLDQERRSTVVEQPSTLLKVAARRRRTAASALLAAAAVVVVGAGVGQVLPDAEPEPDVASDSAGSTAGSSESAEERLSSAPSDRAGRAASEESALADPPADPPADPLADPLAGGPVLTSDAALASQVRALRDVAATGTLSTTPGCELPGAGRGRRVSVTYDGLPGALVFRPPKAAAQQVALFLCGEPGPLRSVRLPAR